jgi:hypothetical protein
MHDSKYRTICILFAYIKAKIIKNVCFIVSEIGEYRHITSFSLHTGGKASAIN